MNTMIDISPANKPNAPHALKQNVINQLKTEQNMKNKKLFRKISIAAAILVMAVVIIPISGIIPNAKASSQKLITTAIKNMASLENFVMKFQVRVAPNTNFSKISPNLPFVNHTLTKSILFWRIEKQKGMLEEFAKLLEPHKLLENALNALESNNSKTSIKNNKTQTTIVIEAPALGNFDNDYALNSSIDESYSRRTYTFDKHNKRLESFAIEILIDGKYTTVVKSDQIKYNQPLAWKAELKKPNIEWRDMMVELKNEKLSGITSSQAINIMLKALENSDIAPIKEAFYSYSTKFITKYYGLKIISMGTPFSSGLYAGEFVPCKIKLKDETTKDITIAIRNDNNNKLWIIDGGI